MSERRDLLWPYGRLAALVALPVLGIVLLALLAAARAYGVWSDAWSGAPLLYFVLLVSAVPLFLVLLDFLASRKAAVDIKGFKIDFAHVDLTEAGIVADTFELPDNIGIPGAIVSDSSPMQIVDALRDATQHEVAIIDIKSGDAWWTTRLLALSAGAVRAGSPNALVFVGVRAKVGELFLGWGTPLDIRNAILDANPAYAEVFERAKRIAAQVELFGDFATAPPALVMHAEVQRYTSHPDFATLGYAVFEQILMDQIAKGSVLENPPDRMTLARLQELFGHCLYEDRIDLTEPKELQVRRVLDVRSSYIALVRAGKFQSLLRREDGDRLILRQLLLQSALAKTS